MVPLLDEGAQLVMGYLRGWRRSHPDGHELARVGFRVLDDGTETDACGRESLGDVPQMGLITSLEGDSVCSGLEGAWGAFSRCVD